MLKTLEKSWSVISFLLLALLLTSLFFRPILARPLGLTIMILSLGLGVIFTLQRHLRVYRQGRTDRAGLRRGIFVEVLSILLTMSAVILAAGKLGGMAGQAAGRAWGIPAGILAGLIIGVTAGFLIGWLVRWVRGKLFRLGKGSPVSLGTG